MRHVDDLVKSGRRIARNVKRVAAGALIGAALAYSLSGCGDPKIKEVLCRNDIEIGVSCDDENTNSNSPPATTITVDFGTGDTGYADWKICGEDSDGHVVSLDSWIKGVYQRNTNPGTLNPYCVVRNEQIDLINNPGEGSSIDNDGAVDQTNYSLDVPNEAQARTLIDTKLTDLGYVEGVDYDKDVPVTIDGMEVIVDYRVKNPDSSVKAFITLGYSPNLQNDLDDIDIIDQTLKPHAAYVRITLDKIASTFDDFSFTYL